jgi:hypothetical protein
MTFEAFHRQNKEAFQLSRLVEQRSLPFSKVGMADMFLPLLNDAAGVISAEYRRLISELTMLISVPQKSPLLVEPEVEYLG